MSDSAVKTKSEGKLKYIDETKFVAIIMDAWQNHLQTEKDPASGRWFANGPHNNGGLYGNLKVELAKSLVFKSPDSSKGIINLKNKAIMNSTIDNRNGIFSAENPPKATLAYTYTTESTTSMSTTNSITTGVEASAKVSGEFAGIGAEASLTASIGYEFSWSGENTNTKGEQITFTQELPLEVPVGKVYRAYLICDVSDVEVDFDAVVYLTGNTVANFSSPVNNQETWIESAGSLCEWIRQYDSAGDESAAYSADPSDKTRGIISISSGKMTAEQTVNFLGVILDVTDHADVNVGDIDKQYKYDRQPEKVIWEESLQ